MRSWSCFFGLALCTLVGCQSSGSSMRDSSAMKTLAALGIVKDDKGMKPPKAPEQYVMPPESEVRFARHIEYPEGTLNQHIGKSKDSTLNPPPTIGANNAAGMSGGANQGMSGVGGMR